MREFMLALLTCSVTMSAIALIHITVSPLLSKYCSAKSRYYAWLIVVIGLLIPFRPGFDSAVVEISIPAETVNTAPVLNYVPIDRTFLDSRGTVDAGTVTDSGGAAEAMADCVHSLGGWRGFALCVSSTPSHSVCAHDKTLECGCYKRPRP